MDPRDVQMGEHAARLDNIDRRLGSMEGKLDDLVAAEARRQGANRFATAFGAFIGTVVGFVISLFGDRLKP